MMPDGLLKLYGYDNYKEDNDQEIADFSIGRIISCSRNMYDVVTDDRILKGCVTGKFRYNVEENGGYPVVGDYVEINAISDEMATIENILSRKTVFYRRDNWSKSGIQILASNFSSIMICSSLNKDFSLNRIERYVLLSISSGAKIYIVLTKSDLCSNYEEKVKMCEDYFSKHNITVIAISSLTGMGMDELKTVFDNGEEVLLLGSSGVGKSSLVNALANKKIMNVGAIREDDDKGKHTTVSRQMICLHPGIIIDTPGLREVGMISIDDSLTDFYEDIKALETQCKYRNCNHTNNAGCAVLQAIVDGRLSKARYSNYLKMKFENTLLDDRENYLFNKWQRSKERSRNLKDIRKKGGKNG